ncbi:MULTISPECIES: hypothetical protein [Kitasatospora]|uniref:Uncharacterized protein n=1 Tax=Kitasatospora cathayae TaxID=3004092 RepID=A0ABY7Q381_9ACTN|nr:hypothetical protein [Kitasatospora sp. HUAS 3-15]WBP87094.1 hypothetical protein O1G21_15400 [Kitasatospora sp. HUAS 3-15]
MPKLQQRVIEGPFGPIQISHDRWPSVIARVQGAGMPTVTVVPDRDHGAMNINGHDVPTTRARNRTRTAVVGDRAYELRPTSLRRAELRRNGVLIAHARGTYRSYAPGSTIPGLDARVNWSQGIDPTDVAVGQAMLLAFGAGAPGALLRFCLFWYDNFGPN